MSLLLKFRDAIAAYSQERDRQWTQTEIAVIADMAIAALDQVDSPDHPPFDNLSTTEDSNA